MVRIMAKAVRNSFNAVALAATVVSNPTMAQTSGSFSSRSVVISIPDRKLPVLEDDVVTAMFPVAVGTAVTPSPTGQVPHRQPRFESDLLPPGRDDSRWQEQSCWHALLGLSVKGYGIHGTNAPSSIGRAGSHGCIRLRNRDIERLFAMLQIGDRVEIHGEHDGQTVRLFGPAPTPGDRAVAEARTDAQAGETSQDGLEQ